MLRPIDVAEYFTKEIDDRSIKTGFNPDLMQEVLAKSSISTDEENVKSQNLQLLAPVSLQ